MICGDLGICGRLAGHSNGSVWKDGKAICVRMVNVCEICECMYPIS